MEKLQRIWRASLFGRIIAAIMGWFGRQWSESRVVTSFLTPTTRDEGISDSSIFRRLWSSLCRLLSRIYAALRLDKLFSGSIFLQTFLWTLICVTLAPLAPTMVALGLAAVGYFSLALVILRDKSRTPFATPMNRYIFIYVAIYAVGTLTSVTRSSLNIGMLTVAFVLFCIVLQNSVQNKKQLDYLIRAIVLAGTLVALYGLYQYAFQEGHQSNAWVDSDMFSSISFRVFSTLQNPNMLGQYLILTIALCGALLLDAKDWGSRILWLGCLGVMGICMILTFARGAWLGLIIGAAVFLLLLNPRLVLLLPVALVAMYFILPETVISRFTSIGNLSDSSTSYRVNIWLGSLSMLKDYWLSGIGPGEGAFNQIYPVYSYNAVYAPHSHNLFLQMVCDAGITLLLAFIGILFHYFRQLAVSIRNAKSWRGRIYQSAAFGAVVGFLVQAMTDYSFYNYRVMLVFWIFIAVGARIAKRDSLKDGGILT